MDRWLYLDYVEPVLPIPRAGDLPTQFAPALPALPPRRPAALHPSLLAVSDFVPVVAEAVTVDFWYRPLSEPVRLPHALRLEAAIAEPVLPWQPPPAVSLWHPSLPALRIPAPRPLAPWLDPGVFIAPPAARAPGVARLPDMSRSMPRGQRHREIQAAFDFYFRHGSLIRSGRPRPAASAALRGHIWHTPGAAGVADTLAICVKDSADAYAWVAIVDAGEPIPIAFSAGNFTGSGSMTWTVDEAFVSTLVYTLRGDMLTVAWAIHNTSVGGTLSDELRIALPAGFVSAAQMWGVLSWLDDNATPTTGSVFVDVGDTSIRMFRTDLANFSAATLATAVAGTITLKVF